MLALSDHQNVGTGFHLYLTVSQANLPLPRAKGTREPLLSVLEKDFTLKPSLMAHPVCWPCSVHYFLSLFQTLQDASCCTLSHIYTNNIWLNRPWSGLSSVYTRCTVALWCHMEALGPPTPGHGIPQPSQVMQQTTGRLKPASCFHSWNTQASCLGEVQRGPGLGHCSSSSR